MQRRARGDRTATECADSRDDARGLSFTAEEVVGALYRGILDRMPDPTGVSHHVDLLAGGLDLPRLVHGIRTSEEASVRLLRSADLAALGPNLWRASVGHGEGPKIYFLHIMKTGGTSLTRAVAAASAGGFCLTQIFLDHLAVMPRLALERASLVAGHLGIEALDLLPPDTLTVTVLRHPVERTLSHYAHVLTDPAIIEESEGLSLEEFVFSPRWRPLASNFQARNLVHRVGLSRAWVDFAPEKRLAALGPAAPRSTSLPLQSLFELAPLGLSDAEVESRGRERLESIDFVGVASDLDELWTRLAPAVGTSEVAPVRRLNVSAGRLPVTAVPPSLLEAIEQANEVDLALYERARELVAARHGAGSRATMTTALDDRGDPDGLVGSLIPVAGAGRAARSRSVARGLGGGLIWALGVLMLMIVSATDAIVGGQVILIGALVSGPCFALASWRWRPTAAVGALAVAMAVGLGAPDHIWGTGAHYVLIAVVALFALAATAAAALAGRRRGGAGRGDRRRGLTNRAAGPRHQAALRLVRGR